MRLGVGPLDTGTLFFTRKPFSLRGSAGAVETKEDGASEKDEAGDEEEADAWGSLDLLKHEDSPQAREEERALEYRVPAF